MSLYNQPLFVCGSQADERIIKAVVEGLGKKTPILTRVIGEPLSPAFFFHRFSEEGKRKPYL